MKFFDTHAHYNDEKFNDDLEDIIQKTLNDEIDKFTCVGWNIEMSKKALEIAKKYENIYAVVGISPLDVPDNLEQIDEMISKIEKIALNEKVAAIGEIGLDYHYEGYNKEIQKEFFKRQIELANKLDLPIVIHSRDAWMDTIDIIQNSKCQNKGIFHCCQLNIELVKQALKLDYYISFAGPITFKNTKNAKQIVEMVPLDKILVETDSPYLAPEPKRGTRNNCINVKYIVEKIAEFKQMKVEEIAEITYNNGVKAFNIK